MFFQINIVNYLKLYISKINKQTWLYTSQQVENYTFSNKNLSMKFPKNELVVCVTKHVVNIPQNMGPNDFYIIS
jgi:hypothetical protein